MKLQDCILDADSVVAAPLIRKEPQRHWAEAYESGTIPKSLYLLYSHADYCSYDRVPIFLDDPKKQLFPYYCILLNGLLLSFSESKKYLSDIVTYNKMIYTPIKHAKGEKWDPEAAPNQMRAFKALVIELMGSLDLMAEIVALFLPGQVSGLQLGRTMYSSLHAWTLRPLEKVTGLVSPTVYYTEMLHDKLSSSLVTDVCEVEWYDLLNLYRNKIAHLGSSAIRKFAFHDTGGNFYNFLPKSWPFLWEEYLQIDGQQNPPKKKIGKEIFEQILVNEDFVSFADHSRAKIANYLDVALSVLDEAYLKIKDSPVNGSVLQDLDKSRKDVAFTNFAPCNTRSS